MRVTRTFLLPFFPIISIACHSELVLRWLERGGTGEESPESWYNYDVTVHSTLAAKIYCISNFRFASVALSILISTKYIPAFI